MKKRVPPVFPPVCGLGFSFVLLLLCSCAAARDQSAVVPASVLPADVTMNKEVGRGQKLHVPVRLDNGKELLFVVDTGAGATILDKSLEPMLERYHLGWTTNINFTWWGTNLDTGLYEAPKLYSGNTQLLTGDVIYSADLSQIVDRPVVGILGMDCLRHYCVQLDFAAGKIRFGDPGQLNGQDLGEEHPLTFLADGRPLIHANLFGHRDEWEIDTGCDDDAALKPELFQRKVQELGDKSALGTWLTTTSTNYAGRTEHEGFFQKAVFDGQSFTNFVLRDCPDQNLVGLRFLARHLVTLNFPKNTMYLQRRSGEPFADEDIFAKAVGVYSVEAGEFLSNLKQRGELPGWLKDEHGKLYFSNSGDGVLKTHPISQSIIAIKEHGDSQYHYLVTKASKDSAWKLQRAWRTDGNEHVIEEYPLP